MSQYKAYPAYKDSGVEWLGSVPDEWLVLPMKRATATHRRNVSATDLNDEDVLHYSIPSVQETGFGAAEHGSTIDSNKLVITCPQVLVSKLNPRKGTVITAEPSTALLTVASTEFVPLIPVNGILNLTYLRYFTSSATFRSHLESLVESVTKSHQRVNPEDILNASITLPGRIEQQQIADALDRETTRIDALIEKKTRFIELLKEKRQALITHAVTKGLDPNVPMKDSGVEWIGEVPEHWKVVTARRLISDIEQGWSPECHPHEAAIDRWGVLKAGCVNRGDFDASQNKELPEHLEENSLYEVKAGDILMSRASGSPELVGSTAIVDQVREKLMISDKIFRPRLQENCLPRFFYYLMNSTFMRSQIELALSGGNGLANNLPQSALMGFRAFLPPKAEQEELIIKVDKHVSSIESLIRLSAESIRLLQERRSALITAAVTGQIDLRSAA